MTPRIGLRAFTLDDAPFIVRLLNDPGWLRFIGDRGVRSEDDARRYLREGPLAHAGRHGFALGAVTLAGTNETIGMCGLIRRDSWDEVDLGYALLPEARGQGYAREAAALCLADGFANHGLARIVAITHPANAASQRVLEAIGMTYERRVRMTQDGDESLLYAAMRSGEASTGR